MEIGWRLDPQAMSDRLWISLFTYVVSFMHQSSFSTYILSIYEEWLLFENSFMPSPGPIVISKLILVSIVQEPINACVWVPHFANRCVLSHYQLKVSVLVAQKKTQMVSFPYSPLSHEIFPYSTFDSLSNARLLFHW